MSSMRIPLFVPILLGLLYSLPFPAHALDDLVITEFMAENDDTLDDEDGDNSDWIEIYNAGTNTVNLNGWRLTDSPGVAGWRFPATNLPVNSFIIVFASGKDRRIPGRPLHTDFRLNDGGDYLALRKPDGTVQFAYEPAYPPQVPDVSYGIPVTLTTNTLLTTGAAGKFTVPLNDTLGLTWTLVGFNDNSWVDVNNGVGFEGDAPPSGTPTLIADSVADWSLSGTQGQNSWQYGYWDKEADANGTYEAGDFTPFPRTTGNVLSSVNYWDGTRWNWPAGDPPWTELNSTGGHPNAENGNAALPIHWAVRRYVSENSGPLRITGTLACNSVNGTCGDGVIGRIFVDGVEVFQRAVMYSSEGYSIVVAANLGSTIDFAIDPGAGNNDFCDATTFTAVIRTSAGAGIVADTIADWSNTGAQGANNWTYGYWIKTNAAATYTAGRFNPFPGGTGPHSSANFWNGQEWHWFQGDPPFDTIGQITCLPNIFVTSSSTNNLEHWVIRRWVSPITGQISIDWHFAKKDLDPTGNGLTARVWHNSTQRDTHTLTGNDFAGTNRTIATFSVQAGDTIDFTVEPGANIYGDLSFLNATILGVTSLSGQFATDVGALMTNINSSAYLRFPFTVTNALATAGLRLRVKYDDAFAAWLNGTLLAVRNAPDAPAWNAVANAERPDAAGAIFEDFDLTSLVGVLHPGTNILAIQAINRSAADQDLLLAAELTTTSGSLNAAIRNYFSLPSPGAVNGVGSTNLGPVISRIQHRPHDPRDHQDLFITARIQPSQYPVTSVRAYYRVQFGAETGADMLDDGLHGDGVAGDGIYGAVVPNASSTFGQMIRYYIVATDDHAGTTRQPPFPHAQWSAQYFGAVVQNPALTNPLPVLHLFIVPADLNNAGGSQAGRFPCSIYWMGEFYDNVGINRHGQSSQSFPKRSYDVDFNAGHGFRWNAELPRVDDINLLTTYPDKAHMRNHLAYESTFKPAGSPYHYVVPIRIQTNGGFFGDWALVENGDADFLERIGRDPNGALYKMYNTFTGIGNTVIGGDPNAEKKTRREEGNADLVAMFNGIANTATPLADRIRYMYDNVNVSEVLNTLAARTVTADWDCCHKNYYFYRDTDGTGEWEAMPWDIDLSYGRNWSSSLSYWDPAVYPGNRIWGNWDNNGFFQVLLNMPAGRGVDPTHQMYIRRVRTLMDELQQPNGTPAEELYYEKRIDELAAIIAPDAALDLAKWGTWGDGTSANAGPIPTNSQYYHTLAQSVSELKTNYLPRRRTYVFNQNMGLTGGDLFNWTNAQPSNVVIQIGSLDYNPASRNQAEEYIQLINTNRIAVDISGWKLAGAVEHTFQGGVVIPAGNAPTNVLYVVPDKKAFRARATAPRGGMNLLVEGSYKGQLSARGETLVLINKAGRTNFTTTYTGNPSGPQHYLRITEIMYHPPNPPSGSPYEAEDFEYIELRNIGPTNQNLTGVHFTNGVEFTFTGSAVTTLAPGDYVLVVRNLAAFTSRYGSSANVAGQYVGILDNGGERIQIHDAAGESIHDFDYENDWYPITDGPGASLVIVDENADERLWGSKTNWRPSALDFGSPGQADPTPGAPPSPIIINELLTHTDGPGDAIELLNPTGTDADLSGWFLSDDFATPKKFRLPANTVIPAGGFLVFYESNSFGLGPNGFAISSKGDETYLYSGDGTNLTGYVQGYSFGAAENGISFGRYTNSQTNVHFVAQSALTLGQPNAAPKVGPVVISEIHYRPDSLILGADNVIDEFIELANITGGEVPLFDPTNPANTWRLRSAVDFDFPTNIMLPAGGHIVVVSFDPAETELFNTFTSRFSVPASVPVVGPWNGQLGNTGESIRLSRPDAPDTNDVPYILVDQVDYSNRDPWTAAADGIGLSLQRLVESNYGNEPLNWIGAAPSAGATYLPGSTPPSITTQPQSITVISGRTATFSVGLDGTPPFQYRWRFNGTKPVGSSPVLTLPNELHGLQPGAYNVIVFNSAGSAVSANANLTVVFPPSIVLQPTNRAVWIKPDPRAVNTPGGTNVTFVVGASSLNTGLRYQWLFNGANLLNATNASLTITNVQLEHEGDYLCVVSDSVDTVSSAVAHLTPLIQPIIVQAPLGQTVVEGSDFSHSVEIIGNPVPIGYSWRRALPSATLVSNYVSARSNFITLNSTASGLVLASGITSSNYELRVVIFNEANLSPGVLVRFTNTVVADFDRDGIPDTVENALGLAPNDPADGAGDLDGDGMNNRAEYIAGTDPANPASYLKIDSITAGGGSTLTFGAISNKTYTIQYTDQLGSGTWTRLKDVFARTTNRTETVFDPVFTTNRAYRVATPFRP